MGLWQRVTPRSHIYETPRGVNSAVLTRYAPNEGSPRTVSRWLESISGCSLSARESTDFAPEQLLGGSGRGGGSAKSGVYTVVFQRPDSSISDSSSVNDMEVKVGSEVKVGKEGVGGSSPVEVSPADVSVARDEAKGPANLGTTDAFVA